MKPSSSIAISGPAALAQYGIYPTKIKMKTGLRKQFEQTLALSNVHYCGHVKIGASYDLSLADLESFRPAAIVFASGAQGAKKLGLPGEDAAGVYAAKDFVYHYNQLESYAGLDFSAHKHIGRGRRGNVAIDVARWLLKDKPGRTTESVTIVARRGPLEVKFDVKEIGYVEAHINRDHLVHELERVSKRCARVGQDVSPEAVIPARFPGLARPTSYLPTAAQLPVSLFAQGIPSRCGRSCGPAHSDRKRTRAERRRQHHGARYGSHFGARCGYGAVCHRRPPRSGHRPAMGPDGYAVKPVETNQDTPSYEVWDPQADHIQPGRFVVGWARKASTGWLD